MNTFNKYGFIENLTQTLLQEVLDENLNNIDEIHEYIQIDLDNAVIYYQDCFEIAQSLSLTCFTGFELGDATTINQLAYFGLYEFVNEELDFSLIELAIKNREEFIKFAFSDNCINVSGGKTKTQCTQYSKEFTQVELFEYYLKEYAN